MLSGELIPMHEALMNLGMVRLAVAAPELNVADVAGNVERIGDVLARSAEEHDCRIILFPELSLTGYTCGDLFFQDTLHAAVLRGISRLEELCAETSTVFIVGAPLVISSRLFNCALIFAAGQLLGIVPKIHLPNTAEFYEKRWFSSGAELDRGSVIINDVEIPCGTDLLFSCVDLPDLKIGIELCEDLWAVSPPSGYLAAAGATLLCNPSASPEHVGKAGYRRDLVRLQSARCLSAYAYAGAGPGESSTDLVFGGHGIIAENGAILTETERFQFASNFAVSEVDITRLAGERRRSAAFASSPAATTREIYFTLPPASLPLHRPINAHPFVPADPVDREQRCREIFAIQSTGLARRIRHTQAKKLIIGVSGGLDSTLALLVAAAACDRLELPRSTILAVTMPGPGTTTRTRGNAGKLSEALGCEFLEIPIHEAVEDELSSIGHDGESTDVTYENVQARQRTEILMNIAGLRGGFVVGTGDLSELALGWCTYNGDHMSMYGVNAGVPKTLVQSLVAWCAQEVFQGDAAGILTDVVATPISPELLPPAADGTIGQRTEDLIGPYELHDFFLYHAIRHGQSPRKVLTLATHAFGDAYDEPTIRHWLKEFIRRFFAQQFKRSCLPDGPKVGTVTLSPRGDWRMPSDATATEWLKEL